MHIIIIGAGQTGSSLAASLVLEHNITLIDLDEERLNELQAQYDLRTVHGNGAYPRILTEAGADSADMLIAMSNDDETNMIACFVAATIFKIPLKIARVRAGDYFTSDQFFAGERSPVDIFINPAQLITHTITHLIEYPGALRVFDFADDRVKLVAAKPLANSVLIDKTAEKLSECLPGVAAKIIAIYRHDRAMPLDTTIIESSDDILFLSENAHVSSVLNILRPASAQQKPQRIMIIGGGYIGSHLAQLLEKRYQVKLIEQNRQRCLQLAEQLTHTLILHGNGCDSLLLRNEEVENIDCFCALSNSDADNIVSSLHSKQLGAKQVIALVNRDAYLSLIISGYVNVDVALSPQQITISAILKHLRKGQIIQAYSLRRGLAEALEIAIHPNSTAAGRPIAQLPLPKGTQISAIIRDQKLLIPKSSDTLQSPDHVIVFVSDKNSIPVIENLFATQDKA